MRLDRVGKRYGIRLPWVVRQVSLEIAAGSLVRFEGRNGSGKSTLLRIIAGVATPSRGTVTGRPVTGFVPERFPAALPFPAREYLGHLGRVHGLAGPGLDVRIDGCLDRLGGRDLAPVPLRNMSKGMCQKVAVAQALLPESGLLVLDEAWTGLDVEAKAALDEAVAERVACGGSVVYVDHDPARLAHLGPQRWRLESASAIPVDGVPADGGAGAAPGPVMVIEVSGVRESIAETTIPGLPELPGVLSAQRSGDRVVVRAERDTSDAVLRLLLAAGDQVHVVRVDPERGPASPRPESAGFEVQPGRAPGGAAGAAGHGTDGDR